MIACLSPRCPFLLLLIGPNRSFLTRNWWSLPWPHLGVLSHCLLLIPQQIKFDKKLMITTLTTLRCPFALPVIDTPTDQIWQEIDNYSLTTPATRTLRRPSQRWSTHTRPSLWTTVLWWTSTKTPRTKWSGGKISIDYYFDQWLEPIKSIEKPKLCGFIRLLYQTICGRELQNTVCK